MLVLGFESTCDETACSIVRDGASVLSNIVASQMDLQATYGGVVPELACRRHIDMLIPVLKESLETADVSLEQVNLIAAARGPGLIGALLIGLNSAKALAWSIDRPFIGINHVEAHLYGALMSYDRFPQFPAMGVVLSGGHTSLILIRGIGDYQLVGQTVDDAIGEAFDKAAKILGLPYPGGPHIEKLAKDGDPFYFPLRSGKVKQNPYNFSFSGLKTGTLYAAKGQSAAYRDPLIIDDQQKRHLAASFQQAAFSDVVAKALKAARKHGCEALVFGGGVCCNRRLREMFQEAENGQQYYWPALELTLDNAAMIAGLGYHKFLLQDKVGDSFNLEAKTRMQF